jgi:hypothetical protein
MSAARRFMIGVFTCTLIAAAPHSRAGDGDWLNIAGDGFHFDHGKGRVTVEERLRAENWDDTFGLRLSDAGDEWLVYHRLLVTIDHAPTEWFSYRAQLRDSRVHAGPRGYYTDGDKMNGFAIDDPLEIGELSITLKQLFEQPVEVTVGRQYWAIGDQRLIGHLKWTNNTRYFDGVKAVLSYVENWPLTLYAGRHVNQFSQNDLNDIFDTAHEEVFIASIPNHLPTVDDGVIYLVLSDRKTPSALDSATLSVLSRWSFGNGFSLSNETAMQLGDEHLAGAVSLRGTYAWQDVACKPQVALEANWGSGDSDPGDGDSHTFDNLYHTNHAHYGVMDGASWRNARSLGLLTQAKPHERWTTQVNLWLLGLDQPEDQWYAAAGAPVGSAAKRANDSRFIGTELDVVNTVKVCKNLSVELGLSYLWAGDATEGRSGGEDGSFAYLQGVLTY